MPKHWIVVSAENNGYIGWQCKVFHYSCVSRTSFLPVFVVHAMGDDWHPDFCELAKTGALVRSAPTYTNTPRDIYVPKNTAGTLLHAAELFDGDDFIVLCDPDMVFVREPAFPSCLSADHYDYMNYDRPSLRAAAERMQIPWDLVMEQHQPLRCGVPYVVPVCDARELALAWLDAVDEIWPRMWEDVMYAFGLAVLRLGLRIHPTQFMAQDHLPEQPTTTDMIHYCQGSPLWDKRNFHHDDEPSRVWHPSPSVARNTVLGEVFLQIDEARRFYAGELIPRKSSAAEK